mgnify:CR=1 FL=1
MASDLELIGIIREGGIVGMGGATFPTHVKLSGGIGKVDTVIINAGECEPYITADDRLCREHPAELMKGLKIIMKIFGLTEGHIAIEDNKPEAIQSLKEHQLDGIVLDVLPAKYPQGAEKQLIYAVTGREVPSGGLPAAVGCAVSASGLLCEQPAMASRQNTHNTIAAILFFMMHLQVISDSTAQFIESIRLGSGEGRRCSCAMMLSHILQQKRERRKREIPSGPQHEEI